MTEIRFDGQVAVVTGAGGGLGRSYAIELARRGAYVVVNDFGGNADGTGGSKLVATRTVDEITAEGGVAVASHESVATSEGGGAIVRTALDAFGRVDIAINNAGILRDRMFHKLGIDDLRAVLDVHLLGAFHVSQPAFRVMRENGYGRFLFTSSSSGLFGNIGQTNYGAAKAALVGLSNVLALEGARHGITSNVIAPTAFSRLTAERLADHAQELAPELVTPLALYLVSQECRLTHEIFSAGGGRFARVFIGFGPGWQSPSRAVSVEDVRDHLDEISAVDGFVVPASMDDEADIIARMLV